MAWLSAAVVLGRFAAIRGASASGDRHLNGTRMPSRSMLVVVPYLLVPAGLAATEFAIAAAVLTHRFRRASRG